MPSRPSVPLPGRARTIITETVPRVWHGRIGVRVPHVDEVPVTSTADVEAVYEEFDGLDVRDVDEALGTEEMKVKVWRSPPGETIGVHGHSRQEELYYVLDGTFSVRIGPLDDTETVEVGPGAFFAASPEMVREYESTGTEDGVVLVVAAPNVDEGGIPEHEMSG